MSHKFLRLQLNSYIFRPADCVLDSEWIEKQYCNHKTDFQGTRVGSAAVGFRAEGYAHLCQTLDIHKSHWLYILQVGL